METSILGSASGLALPLPNHAIKISSHKDHFSGILPFELVSAIFSHTCPKVQSRVRLTHTCGRWRAIALQEASLWTYMEIPRMNFDDLQEHQNLLSLLKMQLSRTAGLPLDVVMFLPETTELCEKLMDFFGDEDTSSHLRTLVLRLDYSIHIQNPEHVLYFTSDTFSGLRDLTIAYASYHDNIVQRTIDHCTGVRHRLPNIKFNTLDLPAIKIDNALINKLYAGRLANISSLVLPNHPGSDNESSLIPESVKDVTCERRDAHSFPYVNNYTLVTCIFNVKFPHSMGSLAHLTVTRLLKVTKGCSVTLPVLRKLSCGTIEMESDSALSTPLLEDLHLLQEVSKWYSSRTFISAEGTERSISNPGYDIYPIRSIIINTGLSAKGMVGLLSQCREVNEVSLFFGNKVHALGTMNRFLDDRGPEERASMSLGGLLCPKMAKLKLSFHWLLESDGKWAERAAKIVARRKGSGVDLVVYAMWGGEDVYTRLA